MEIRRRSFGEVDFMQQHVSWPVIVDMTLIRDREKDIIASLRQKYTYFDDGFSVDVKKMQALIDDQERLRTEIINMINSDEALATLKEPMITIHKAILVQCVLDEAFGFGPLGPVLRDPSVFDIFVKGHDAVYVERAGRFEKSSVFFENEQHLLYTIAKIIMPLGHVLSEESPVVRAMLPNGSCVVAALPYTGQAGPTLVIRCALTGGSPTAE